MRASSSSHLVVLGGDLRPEVLAHLVVGLAREELADLAQLLAGGRPVPPRVDDRLQLGVAPARVSSSPPVPRRMDTGELGLEPVQFLGELTELLEHGPQGTPGRAGDSGLKGARVGVDTAR